MINTMEVELFGKKYQLKVEIGTDRSCGLCHYGLVDYVRRKEGVPYIFMARCTCFYGRDYSILARIDNETVKLKPDYPTINPDDIPNIVKPGTCVYTVEPESELPPF